MFSRRKSISVRAIKNNKKQKQKIKQKKKNKKKKNERNKTFRYTNETLASDNRYRLLKLKIR